MSRHSDPEMIKCLLAAWALHRAGHDTSMPDDVRRIDQEIHRLSPQSVRILELQYCDPGPQKSKAALLKMSREMFSARLRWIHEQLSFTLLDSHETS